MLRERTAEAEVPLASPPCGIRLRSLSAVPGGDRVVGAAWLPREGSCPQSTMSDSQALEFSSEGEDFLGI